MDFNTNIAQNTETVSNNNSTPAKRSNGQLGKKRGKYRKIPKGQPKIEDVVKVFEAGYDHPDSHEMWKHYGEVLHRAVDHGRMATPERMAALYPILREIADESYLLI